MKQETLDLTYQVIDEIKQSEDYIRLQELHQIIETDSHIIKLIESFNKYKEKYQEVKKYGKYHPDLKQVQAQFAKSKTELYENEIIKEYKELEKRIQQTLDQISTDIANAISNKIKHPNEIGLINKK